MNPKVNYGFWMIMICQCRFIFGKNAALVRDIDNECGYAFMGSRNIWEISVTPQFCGKNKALKYTIRHLEALLLQMLNTPNIFQESNMSVDFLI